MEDDSKKPDSIDEIQEGYELNLEETKKKVRIRTVTLFCLSFILIITAYLVHSDAVAKGDINSCLNKDTNQIQGCLVSVMDNSGLFACRHMAPEPKQECYVRLAIKKNSPRLCKNTGSLREYYECMGEVALENQNIRLLENIDSDYLKGVWLTRMALRYNNTYYCKLIADQAINGLCHYEFAIITKDTGYCMFIDESSHLRKECFEESISKLKD
ncbi:hypothetical protein COV93_02215 [Candidatus Woesearchaeota archaeon CG11_big_fil_rev_8_21_14_0_20_43_8]|nr:MAG: hypothetical protein COV93_02215 [Candidatus Woesearchaeota archaeon CG11_big_fil_rev_8_21_14_0_20_43_8]PIO08089.1 MAG: hypothetical protein COT47_01270 [Candidatus Woesearchaeota archaeon CG08_land_8_20_14_0_20_43_7]